jgi:argininosuccinate lyase
MRPESSMKSSVLVALVVAALACSSSFAQTRSKSYLDAFGVLNELNKASTVMVVEQGIVPKALGAKIAQGLIQVIADGEKRGAKRPGDYLAYEPLLIAYVGPDATRMHSGRSRQDILPVTRRIMLRDRSLDFMEAMNEARETLLAIAAKHADTIIPGYTNGVQAQPTTFGHYLLGFAGAFDRDAERLRQAYARLNLNPLGVAVYGTSSFPVNRVRLAELLGFDGNVENGYDAAQVSTMDVSAEQNSIASITALTVGNLVQDVHTQYHQVVPWLLIEEGAQTHTSSIMPQKRNPTILNNLRLTASTVVGDAQVYLFQAHNVTPGMPDYKREQTQKTLEEAVLMLEQLRTLFDSLVVNPARALDEVNAEYSTTTELADVLQREADVPFRVGHHFASEIVTFGRARGLRPADLAFGDVVRIWQSAGRQFGLPEGSAFPLTEKRLREALSAEGMIAASRGLGGPQPAEMARMLDVGRKRLAEDRAWVLAARARLAAAQAKLDEAFGALAASR